MERQPLWQTMTASTLAGALARIPCHPLDTVKARLQFQAQAQGAATRPSISAIARSVLRSEGAAGLYRGMGIAVVGSAPAGCLYFTSYEECRAAGQRAASGASAWVDLAAGFAAEAVSCVLWVPVDVVKERLQVQIALPAAQRTYRGSAHALATIARTEGARGLYKGYGATLASFGPFSALYFAAYEQFKSAAGWAVRAPREQLPMSGVIGASCAAGALASFLTNPLDLVKLRIQVSRGERASGAAAFRYTGVLHGLREVVRTGGPRALLQGALARMLFQSPMTAISMSAYEGIKRRLQQ